MILVTGGTGFIGSHLMELLLARGERVRALTRRNSLNKASLFPNSPVEVFRTDLIDGVDLSRGLSGVDTVIHVAGVTKALSIAEYYDGNVRATENLARAVAVVSEREGRPIRFVHVSSLAAVGPGSDATPVTEDAEPHPVTHYGKSKREGERVVRAILPDAVIVRPPAVYGPREKDMFQVLRSVNRGLVMQIAGGERFFSAIYVTDLVDGIIAAALTPRADGRTYFLAHAQTARLSEFVGIAARIMGRKPRMVSVPLFAAYAIGWCAEIGASLTRKPGIVSRDKMGDLQFRYWVCDTRRAQEEIGFLAPTNLAEGLDRTLAWYREAGWLKW